MLKYLQRLLTLWCGLMYATSTLLALPPSELGNDFMEVQLKVSAEQDVSSPPQEIIRLHYRVNRIVIDRNYMNNAQALKTLDEIFDKHPISDIAYIVIKGTASPEGPPRNNEWLSEQRAAALRNYIITNYPGLHDDQIITIPQGEDWDGLETMIKNDKNTPYRNELLQILQSSLAREEQKRRMIRLGNGKSYAYIQRKMLPYLRGGVSSTIYFRDRHTEYRDTILLTRIDTVYLDMPEEDKHKKRRSFYIAIKNNLLYDAALLPNLAIEVPFGKDYRWSAAIEGNWSWWDSGANNYNYHRIQMAGVELRRWFNYKTRRPLNGWYAGIYGYGGTYDVRFFAKKDTDKGYLSDLSYSAGLSVGYSMPIAWRWNLEFGIAAGYFGGKYKKYNHSTCEEGTFPWLSTHNRNYFGLTKAQVSIVWVIGK
ncbi:DUF3575 domain-containing protein [Bacteroides sp. 224]|uniref:DUF3575 domain-containing protein n=1 Tax=Bacteroides sp. 224 TaxID=2302936 RepID=UPI0013D04597|nr:DUF3575 domain-containing protein [Bacteroides sp. 224]NDV65610.1 DUF3575 domain-containing protein [Bacteroides sp. 224]